MSKPKQISLIEVPKDAPSNKELITAFKDRVGIWTHNSGPTCSDIGQWLAMLLPKNSANIEIGHKPYCKNDEPMEIIAGYSRVMEEAGFIVFGSTEREAIQRLCDNINLPCDL